MPIDVTRRDFLTAAAGAVAVASLGTRSPAADQSSPRRLRKAVKYGMVRTGKSMLENFKLLKELGYDGVELDAPNNYKLDDVLKARDEAELPVHGVVDSVHWNKTLSHPDPQVRAEGVDALKRAIHDAKSYGATSVLLVPAVVNAQVSYGDAYRRSQAEIKKAIPTAEDAGIRILIENVWNYFLLSPLEEARYLDELESPMVGAYFDVGNVVRFGWPTHWIDALGTRIGKLDIKEYSRDLENKSGPRAGFGVEIGEGSIDWPAVMKHLADVGYTDGWATAEVSGGDADRLRDIKHRMDRVLTFG